MQSYCRWFFARGSVRDRVRNELQGAKRKRADLRTVVELYCRQEVGQLYRACERWFLGLVVFVQVVSGGCGSVPTIWRCGRNVVSGESGAVQGGEFGARQGRSG